MDPTQNNVFGNQPPMDTGGFGAPVNSGVPMSSGTGDIVLNNDGGKSKKKWWIVILLIVLVAAIVGVVVWYFVVRPSGQGTFVGDTKTLFSEFENYMLYGENDNDADIYFENNDDVADGETIPLENAYFVGVTRLGKYEEQEQYFSRLNKFLNDLRASTNNEVLLSNIERMGDIISTIELLSVVSYTNYILQNYLQNGDDGIDDYLSKIEGLKVDFTYGSILNGIETLILKHKQLYGYYKNKGCMVDKSLDSHCISAVLKNSEEARKLSNEIQILTHNTRENLDYMNNLVFNEVEEMRGLMEQL